jgi:hypothetical protein
MEYYKIRQKSTGLYSTGGHPPDFKKLGKVWPMTQLKAHLRYLQKYTKSFKVYEDCELVSYTEVIAPATMSLGELIEPLEQELIVKKLKGTT